MSQTRSDNLSLKASFGRTDFLGKIVLSLSSWFGVGLIPGARGTFGTMASVPLVFGMNYLGGFYGAVCLFIFIVLAI